MKPIVHSDTTKYPCEAIYTCYFMLHYLQKVSVPIEASSGTQNTRGHTCTFTPDRAACESVCTQHMAASKITSVQHWYICGYKLLMIKIRKASHSKISVLEYYIITSEAVLLMLGCKIKHGLLATYILRKFDNKRLY
jgi:hypothetical protein